MRIGTIACAIGLTCLASGAYSDGVKRNSATGEPIECYCTDGGGDRWELGDIICIDIYGRSFLARCEMSQNNPTWRDLSEGCVASRVKTDPTEQVPS
ncbi:MAG: hypothetical protein AAFQ51_00360 [Pseudomonadota bacterium]